MVLNDLISYKSNINVKSNININKIMHYEFPEFRYLIIG